MEENNKKETKFSTPMAIVVAGLIVAVAVLITKSGWGNNYQEEKKTGTPSEQLGISKEKLTACLEETDTEALSKKITEDVEKAMKNIPAEERGTPYSIVVGKNGVMTEIRGAYPYEDQKDTTTGEVKLKGVKTIVDNALNGVVDSPYTGDVSPVNENDHIYGNKNATVTIIEYSDYECPYCARFQDVAKRIVDESNGNVKWVYRHWPIHQNSFAKTVAAECVAKLKGNDAFWKYSELMFGLLEPEQPSVSDQL